MSTSPHRVGSGVANGITAKVSSAGTKDIAGASRNSTLSAWAGSVSSLSRFLSPSAAGWNSPCGPTRLGPRRSCIQAQMRRSASVSRATPTMITVKTTMVLMIDEIRKKVTPALPLRQ